MKQFKIGSIVQVTGCPSHGWLGFNTAGFARVYKPDRQYKDCWVVEKLDEPDIKAVYNEFQITPWVPVLDEAIELSQNAKGFSWLFNNKGVVIFGQHPAEHFIVRVKRFFGTSDFIEHVNDLLPTI